MIGYVIIVSILVVLLLLTIVLASIGEKSNAGSLLEFFSWNYGMFSTISSAVLIPLLLITSILFAVNSIDDSQTQKFLKIEHASLVVEIEKIKDSDGDLMLVERRVNDYNTKLSKCINYEETFPAFYNFDLDFLKNELGYISFVE